LQPDKGGAMSIIIIGKCVDCGKGVYYSAYVRTLHGTEFVESNFRNFNDGKIKRCNDCCEKQGIKRVNFKGRQG
jgi:hypothetical protein